MIHFGEWEVKMAYLSTFDASEKHTVDGEVNTRLYFENENEWKFDIYLKARWEPVIIIILLNLDRKVKEK